jgi:hypothetical protein
MTELPTTMPFRQTPSSGVRRAPTGGLALRRQADRSSAPPRDPAGSEQIVPVHVGEARIDVGVLYMRSADLRSLGSPEWLPDQERYASKRAEHAEHVEAIGAARAARKALPSEIEEAERGALQRTVENGEVKDSTPRPDAAKLIRQADERLAIAQANLIRWADAVLGEVCEQAPGQLTEIAADQAMLREAQAQAQRELDRATAELRASERLTIWLKSTVAEPSATIGIPSWSSLAGAPYAKPDKISVGGI